MTQVYFPVNPPIASSYDVVVYGGTISGICAAFTAALAGCKVALIEPTNWLGGMMGAGGLISADVSTRSIGGLSWHLWKVMARASNYDPITVGTVTGPNPIMWPGAFNQVAVSSVGTSQGYMDLSVLPGQITPEPKVAYGALNQLAAGQLQGVPTLPPGALTVFKNAPLATTAGSLYPAVAFATLNAPGAITAITTTIGTFNAKVFIDASYEGDIMAAVANVTGGTSYRVGRESSDTYGEGTVAGVQPDAGTNSFHAWPGTHYPVLDVNPKLTTGSADDNIQTMNWRSSIQKIAQGGLAFPKPAGYTTALYAQFQAIVVDAGWTALNQAITLQAVAGNKYCMNDGADIFTMVNQGKKYPDGNPAQRAIIVAAHKLWYQGLLYFSANDIIGANTFKADAATYGLSGDEFQDNGNWPYQHYVREGRRMTGAAKVMTLADCVNNSTSTTGNSVAKSTYVEDCHACLSYANSAGTYVVDGKVGSNVANGKDCQMPPETMFPLPGGCPNLLVPVCHGASHVGWSCLRTEFLFSVLGEAAGFMAARVAKFGDLSVQQINYVALTVMLNSIKASF